MSEFDKYKNIGVRVGGSLLALTGLGYAINHPDVVDAFTASRLNIVRPAEGFVPGSDVSLVDLRNTESAENISLDRIATEYSPTTIHFPQSEVQSIMDKDGVVNITSSLGPKEIRVMVTQEVDLKGMGIITVDPQNHPEKTAVIAVLNQGGSPVLDAKINPGVYFWEVTERAQRDDPQQQIYAAIRAGQVKATQTWGNGNCVPTGCAETKLVVLGASETNGVTSYRVLMQADLRQNDPTVPTEIQDLDYFPQSEISFQGDPANGMVAKVPLGQAEILDLMVQSGYDIVGETYPIEGSTDPKHTNAITIFSKDGLGSNKIPLSVPANVSLALRKHGTTTVDANDAIVAGQVRVSESFKAPNCTGEGCDSTTLYVFNELHSGPINVVKKTYNKATTGPLIKVYLPIIRK